MIFPWGKSTVLLFYQHACSCLCTLYSRCPWVFPRERCSREAFWIYTESPAKFISSVILSTSSIVKKHMPCSNCFLLHRDGMGLLKNHRLCFARLICDLGWGIHAWCLSHALRTVRPASKVISLTKTPASIFPESSCTCFKPCNKAIHSDQREPGLTLPPLMQRPEGSQHLITSAAHQG